MSLSTIGNEFAYNLTPQQRQALAQALAGQSGQPIQNPGGPISPLSVLARGMQNMTGLASQQQAQLPLMQDTQRAALADGAAPGDAALQEEGDGIANALDDQYVMSMVNGLDL